MFEFMAILDGHQSNQLACNLPIQTLDGRPAMSVFINPFTNKQPSTNLPIVINALLIGTFVVYDPANCKALPLILLCLVAV